MTYENPKRPPFRASHVASPLLHINPQCDFASAAGNIISEDGQWRKLTLITEVTDEIWGE